MLLKGFLGKSIDYSFAFICFSNESGAALLKALSDAQMRISKELQESRARVSTVANAEQIQLLTRGR